MSKKILYIGNKLSDKNRNQTTIETLSQQLKALSYNVKSYSNKSNKTLRLISMLSAVIRHRNYDYVLIDTYSTSAFWFAYASAKLCKFFNLKYIMILHGGSLPKRLKSHHKQCRDLFEKAYINVTPSPYLFEEFKKAGYSNLKIIPNGIELKNYTFKKRENIQPKLLWVRAFADIYNPILALKVYKKLLESYPDAQLCMVGPFKDNSIIDCRAYAKKHNLPVEFTGKMSKAEWVNYSEDFDIFINTTNVDNTPVSVIEAMALGLPVVSTNVGGIPYLLDDNENALLVSPNQENEMFKAIINLIEHPSLNKKLTKAARQKVEEFDWMAVTKIWKELLN